MYVCMYVCMYTHVIHMCIYDTNTYYIVSKELLLKGLCGGLCGGLCRGVVQGVVRGFGGLCGGLCGIVGRTTIWRTKGNMYLYLLLFSKFLPANAAHMCQICSYLVHLGSPGSLHDLFFANLCLFTPLLSKSYIFTYRFLLGMYHMWSQI